MVAVKNHIPCSCSLLLLLDSQMGYTQVSHIIDCEKKHRVVHVHVLQASQFFAENFCVSPLDFNGKTMNEMLHRHGEGHNQITVVFQVPEF